MSVPSAIVGTFVLGMLSAAGPCAIPRYVLFAAHMASGVNAAVAVAFLLGCAASYLTLGFAGASIAVLATASHVTYVLLAIALLAGGAYTLLCAPSGRTCCSPSSTASRASLGSAFLSGAGSSIVVSPCCAPLAMALGAQAAQHEPTLAATLVLAFGAGHMFPIAIFAATGARVLRQSLVSVDAWNTISGALLTALGGLYAALA